MGMKDKARIIFIGGIPGVGKSSISGYLARNLSIDIVLSGDYLREFSRPIASDDFSGILGVSVYEAWKKFGDYSEGNVLKGFLEQAKAISLGINAVLKRAVSNGESLVLETLYFVPDFLDQSLLKTILPFYIHISDMGVNSSRLMERDHYTHIASSGDRLARELPSYWIMKNYSLDQCRKHSIRVFDNMNYEATRNDIYAYCKSELGI